MRKEGVSMKFIRIILSMLFMAFPTVSWSQTNAEAYTPFRDVEATDSGIVVTYTFRGGLHQSDPLHEGAMFWKIPGFGLNDNAGEPCFPFRWDSFTIPDDADVVVTLLDSAYTDTLFTLAPAYPPLLDSDTIGYTPDRVPPIASYTGLYPRSSVMKGDVQSYRGQGIVRVATLPVQYNLQTGTVRWFSMIRYLVSFTDRNSRGRIRGRNYASERSAGNISLSDHFLENTTLNYRLSTNGRREERSRSGAGAQLDNRDYLIVSTPAYSEAVNKLAEWKRTKGFRVHVMLRDDWTVASVKTSIMDLYNSEGVNLYYVLFIGGVNDVPAYENDLIYNHVTDYYYGCPEDTILSSENNDILPSIHRGRLLVNNITEANVVISKIKNYEINPPTDSLFYSKGLHCAYFQDLNNDNMEDFRFVFTSEEIKNYLENENITVSRVYKAENNVNPLRWSDYYSAGDSLSVSLRRPNFPWNQYALDIVDGINNKCFYVLYTGHGWATGWKSLGFLTPYIYRLNNQEYLPVIFSMTCLTGQFNTTNCFAENILKYENGGCVAIIAATREATIGFLDCLAEGLISAIWPSPGLYYFYPTHLSPIVDLSHNPIFELGDILDFGLYYLQSNISTNIVSSVIKRNLYNREIFHLFGDPSMMIYTEQPVAINNPQINVDNNTISVRTTDGDARISFYTPGTFPVVDSYLGDSVSYTTMADSVIICIDRHNCIPYVVTYYKNGFIQNETIGDSRTYVGKNIKIGHSVTATKPEGDVVINGADVVIHGGEVELHPGTTIINSNVVINP